jgi:ATP-binding cassette subfamily B protein
MKFKNNLSYIRRDLLRVFLMLWKADRATAVINIVLQFMQALLPVLSLYFIKELIEALVKGNQQLYGIIPLVIAFGLTQLFLIITIQYAAYIYTIHQDKLTDSLAAEVLNKAVEVDYTYYENPAYHDTLHLAQQQSLHRASLLLVNFNSLLLNSLSLLFLLFFFFSLHSLFALLFMVLSIPLAIIKWYSGYKLLRLEREFAPLEREAGYLHQTLTNVSYAKEVRVFSFGNAFIKKFNIIRLHIHHKKQQLHLKLTWYSLIAETVEIIAMTFIFGLLAKYTWEKAITIGVFVIYIQGFQRLQSTSKNFLQSVVQIFQQRIFLQDLFTFLDIKVNTAALGSQPFPPAQAGLIVQNLSFTYPQTSKQVLHNISVSCPPGKIIAIVGENGSGKSTLVKLLARLYELQSGSIKIDETNTNDILINDFRSQSVFLFQDFEKYFLTIEENISLGDEKLANPAMVENAAALSGAHGFISKLSKGYQTRMGRLFEGSEQISGGQWQKLALARVFYKETKLVVLDEPTSALDPTAEFELLKNVKAGLNNKMVILITHRLYNLKIADHIYVMQHGRIVEEGNFETLVNSNGVFRQMYNAQKL